VKVRLLAPLAGHQAGAVLDHDETGAGWLIAGGLAQAVEDEPESDDEPDDQADDEERPGASSARRTRTRRD
jgi:hypothetical protein